MRITVACYSEFMKSASPTFTSTLNVTCCLWNFTLKALVLFSVQVETMSAPYSCVHCETDPLTCEDFIRIFSQYFLLEKPLYYTCVSWWSIKPPRSYVARKAGQPKKSQTRPYGKWVKANYAHRGPGTDVPNRRIYRLICHIFDVHDAPLSLARSFSLTF